MERHCGCKPTKQIKPRIMGCQNRACPAQLPTAYAAFYCCHIIASVFWPAKVQSAKLKPSDPQCKWNEMNMEAWNQRQASAIQCECVWERGRLNRIIAHKSKASTDCGSDSRWRISQNPWIMFIFIKVMLSTKNVFDCERRALCAC